MKAHMHAELISIGDELLTGQKVNTNAPFICTSLGSAGIHVERIIACGDTIDAITGQFRESLERARLVIVTGGLGPTRDDKTRLAVAELVQKPLVFDEATYERTLRNFRATPRKKSPPNLRENAHVIEGSIVIPNNVGMAPGMIISAGERFGNGYLVLLPGVPAEMEAMMQDTVVPFFASSSEGVILHTHLRTTGTGETTIASLVSDIEDTLPPGTTLAYLPHTAGVSLRVSTMGSSRESVERDNLRVVDAIRERAHEYIYALEDLSLEEVIVGLLRTKGLTVATAESCTGGLVASRLTDVPGSSDVFREGYVTYANEVKERLLGVRSETLVRFGAVSREVAGEMALGCLQASGADIAVAATGIAGPSGGSEDKPVGMVCLGLAAQGSEGTAPLLKTTVFQAHGNRQRNKYRFSEALLGMLWHELREV